MSSTLVFYGNFTTGGSGATGLTVTTDVVRITRSDGTQTTVATSQAATEITTPSANGLYLYRITGADLTLYDYIATFKTTGTCDQNRVPALYTPVAADLISIIQTLLTEVNLPANIKKVNDITVTGVGTTGSPWGP